MANVINGSDLMLFINTGTAEVPVYKSIAFATSTKLSLSTETIETSSKDSGGKWVNKEARKLSWNMTSDNLFSLDGEGQNFGDLFSMWTERKKIDVVFSLEKDYLTKTDEVPADGWTPITTGQYKGKVIITSLEANAPDGDNATYTVSFEGTGALTKTV